MRDAVHNAKAAVRFVRKNAERFGVDAAHIAVWGEPWNCVRHRLGVPKLAPVGGSSSTGDAGAM